METNKHATKNEKGDEITIALKQPMAKCVTEEDNKSDISKYAKLSKNLSRSLIIVLSILFIFTFFLIIIQHWKCTLRTNSIIKSNPGCSYQKNLSKLIDDLCFSFQLLIEWLFNMKKTTFSWALDQNSTTLLDPLFSWFFNQYK